MKAAIKSMKDSMQMWGVPRIYTIPQPTWAASPKDLSEKFKKEIEEKTEKKYQGR